MKKILSLNEGWIFCKQGEKETVNLPHTEGHRLVILHMNIPNMISTITTALSEQGVNIENMMNSSKGEYACTLVDSSTEADEDTIAKISAREGIIRVIKID